jgi:hypothetical protein
MKESQYFSFGIHILQCIALVEIRKEFANGAKKPALKEICRRLFSLTFNSRTNCFRSALLKNRIMSKQQCSQNIYCAVGRDLQNHFSLILARGTSVLLYFLVLLSSEIRKDACTPLGPGLRPIFRPPTL